MLRQQNHECCVQSHPHRRHQASDQKNSVALAGALDKLDDKFHDIIMTARNEGVELPEHARSTMWALLCTLQCFDDEDIVGMAAYLND